MMATRVMARTVSALALACAVSMVATCVASGASLVHLAGRTPALDHTPPHGAARTPITLAHGRAHGVIYRRGSLQARIVKADCSSACSGPLFYLGGPVLHTPTAYAIFWEPSGTKFPAKYESTIETFMRNVERSSAEPIDSVFSVDYLYGDENAEGEYGWKFGSGLKDANPLPARNTTYCPEASAKEEKEEKEGGFGLPPKGEPCITDAQLQEQLKEFIGHEKLPTGLGALYFVFTPEGVNSCAGGEGATAECTTNVYCAYHYNVEPATPNPSTDIVYANIPWGDRTGCETPDQPNKSPADDDIDLVNHEGNEAITDPLVGEGKEGAPAWIAYSGNEVADLCTYPFFDPGVDTNEYLDAYGPLLGGIKGIYNTEGELTAPGTAYNQELGGGHYLLQRMWSNAAGGCVAHAPIPVASFANYPTTGVAGEPVSFNGDSSSASAGELIYANWEFGDGSSTEGTLVATHTYSRPGTYTVKLSVVNDSFVEVTESRQVKIEAPSSPPVSLVKEVIKEVIVPGHYSAAQVASALGLPANGKKLSGFGPFTLGHAQCPPACGVTLQLFAKETKIVKNRRTSKWVLIGSVHVTVSANHTATLTLKPTAKGKALLHKISSVPGKLVAAVEGQEGGSWQIERTLTIKR